MKKKVWLVAVAVPMVLLLLFLHLVPYHPFKKKDEIEIDMVTHIMWENPEGTAITEVDITEDIDLEKLELYLQLMKTQRLRSHSVRHVVADVAYYIDGICNGKPMHIIIGPAEENWVYESADRGGYLIENPEAWLQIMELLRQ